MKFIKDFIAIALILGGSTCLLHNDGLKLHKEKEVKQQNTTGGVATEPAINLQVCE